MKYISVLSKSICLMFKRNRVAFILYLVVQVIISLGFVFFFTTVITASESFAKERDAVRMLMVNMDDLISAQDGKDFVAELCKNTPAALDKVTFNFVLKSEQYEKDPEIYSAVLDPEQGGKVIAGRNITRQDVEEENPVIVTKAYNLDFQKDKKNYAVGDVIQLNSVNFTVIGNTVSTTQIPYTTGFDHFILMKMYFLTSSDATDNQRVALGDYIKKKMPRCTVTLPQKISQRALSKAMIPLMAGLFVGVSALVSLLFIFKYMLESSREDHFIFRICGCGEQRLFFILFGELALLFTLCYTVGALLFMWLRRIFEANELFTHSQLLFSHVAFIYFASVLIIAIIMVPYLLKNRKLPLNSGGTV